MLSGEKLGRYEIVRLIGNGGMGEVYLAKDLRLGRQVALKILLPEFVRDENRVKRFMYEARAVSALNHPGIITIHEIVDDNEELFFSTEFVDGETLRELIDAKELDVFKSVSIAEQVADALTVAHKENIVHRDVKPENIMVRKDGIAKVLDFGLAKPLYSIGNDADAVDLLVKTQPGLVIGSVRYMSPEQARGREIDGRTDVWSVGVVLYEMLTGKTPFDGESISDQLAALIHSDPEPLEVIPEELDTIVRKCLQKDRAERYDSIGDLASELKEIRLQLESAGLSGAGKLAETLTLPRQHTSENPTLIHRTISSDKTSGINIGLNPTSETKAPNRSKYFTAAAVVVAGLIAFAGWFSISALIGNAGPNFDSIQVSRLTENGNSRKAAVSPDGKFVAYSSVRDSSSRLIVRQVGTGTEVEIVPESAGNFTQPSFSPDGDFVYYVLIDKGVGTLSRVSSLGGEITEIQKDVDSRPAVSPDGKNIAFFRHDPNRGGDKVFLVGNDGKNLKLLTSTPDIGFDQIADLFWSADGKRVTAAGHKGAKRASMVTDLASIDVTTGKQVEDRGIEIFEGSEWTPAYGFQALKDDTGFLFIGRRVADEAMQIWHLSIKEGTVRPVTTDTSDYEAVSASGDGNILVATKSDWITGLISYDVQSKTTSQIKPDTRKKFGFDGISRTPEGKLLVGSKDGSEINIFEIDPETGEETRLTSGSGINHHPVSSPADGTIVFASSRNNSHGLWKMDKNGGGPENLTKPDDAMDMNPVFINEGESVLFVRMLNDGGPSKLMKVALSGGDAAEVFPGSKTSMFNPRVSDDGKLLAFVSLEFAAEIAKLEATTMIADIDGGVITLRDTPVNSNYADKFAWSFSGNSITKVKSESVGELVEMSLDGKTEKPVMKIDSGQIKSFVWSADGKSLFIVKGTPSSDLVLIKNTVVES